MWPFTKPSANEPVNFGRELAKLRNPNKRAEYKAFHDELRAKLGLPAWEWTDC